MKENGCLRILNLQRPQIKLPSCIEGCLPLNTVVSNNVNVRTHQKYYRKLWVFINSVLQKCIALKRLASNPSVFQLKHLSVCSYVLKFNCISSSYSLYIIIEKSHVSTIGKTTGRSCRKILWRTRVIAMSDIP